MSPLGPTLYLFCGKIAAGKSTLAKELASACGAVLISEDTWLSALFASELMTPKDYMRCTAKLRHIMGPHIASLLNAGLSVALDFQANTVESRKWMRGIIDETGAAHQLNVLAPPDALCLERLRKRNQESMHPFKVSEDQFYQFAQHFEGPRPEERFNVVTHNGQM